MDASSNVSSQRWPHLSHPISTLLPPTEEDGRLKTLDKTIWIKRASFISLSFLDFFQSSKKKKKKTMPTYCPCGRQFLGANALRQHQEAKEHYFCHVCLCQFRTTHDLEQHNLVFHYWPCRHCNEIFSFQENLTQHQESTGHCYCRDCDRFFVHSNALQQHRRSSLHASEFRCCDCDRSFVNERALEQHLIDKAHVFTRTQSSSDHVCWECSREFRDERALEQHRTSLVHRPISNIRCIAGENKRGGCQRNFRSPSALLHHLESGACPSGVTRQKLNMVIQENDTDGIISNPDTITRGWLLDTTRRLPLALNTGALTPRTDSDDDGVVLTPSSTTCSDPLSLGALTPKSDYSGALSISSPLSLSTNRCPLCPAARPPFSTRESLQQHLVSPAHAPQIFHCPVSLFPDPQSPPSGEASTIIKSFSTLSGLAQHLESGACGGGVAAFHKVAGYIENRLKEMGIKSVKLLK